MARDITGQKFGMLTAVESTGRPYKKDGSHAWVVRCDCGVIKEMHRDWLIDGRARSCGCNRSAATTTHGDTIGGKCTVEYKTWEHMIYRCHADTCKEFSSYGGRGITVCKRWRHSYENFLADMGRRPSANHSIDRINNDKGYGPKNCRWATRSEQNNNTRNNRMITFEGKTKTMSQWAIHLGMHLNTLDNRINRGWSINRALTEPVRKRA